MPGFLGGMASGSSGGGVPSSLGSTITAGHLTSDKTIDQVDPNFVDLFTVNATGTEFLVHAVVSGGSDGGITPRFRVLVDGSAADYAAVYGPTAEASGRAVQAILLYHVSGLSNASHAFKLQASYNGTTGWTIHAGSNPTREGACMAIYKIA